MKYVVTLLTIVLGSNLFAQVTIFSDAFVGVSFDMVWVEDDLNVSIFFEPSVQKVNFNDPSTVTLVSEFPGSGILHMDYHEPSNSLYVYSLHNGEINKIDLNDPLPASFEAVTGIPNGGIAGMTIKDDILYITSNRSEVYTLDVNLGSSSLNLYYSDSNTELEFKDPAIYNNDLYFAESMNGPDVSIVKIPLNSGTPQKTLVSDLSGLAGGVQSSIVVQNYLYLGFETQPSRILKIDLEANLPTTAETLIGDLTGAPLGLAYREGVFYVSNGTDWGIYSFTDPNLGVDDFSTQELVVYPSPADDVLYLSLKTAAKNYQVFSVNGNLLIDGDYTAEGIDVSRLQTGIYFITNKDGETKQTKKFVKR